MITETEGFGTKNEILRGLYLKYKLTAEDTFKSPQGWTIITRSGIDKIQAEADIKITLKVVPEMTSVTDKFAAVKAIAKMGDKELETFGEANPANCRQSYILSMAEKRARSRCVLMLTGFYAQKVYGEDESEDFKRK